MGPECDSIVNQRNMFEMWLEREILTYKKPIPTHTSTSLTPIPPPMPLRRRARQGRG